MQGGFLDDEGGVCWGCAPAECNADAARELSRLRHWRYDPARLVLVHRDPHAWPYEVDIERCNTPAVALDWIAQVAGKRWAQEQPACIGELVLAMDLLLGLQQRLCSFGMSRRINARDVLARRNEELGLGAK